MRMRVGLRQNEEKTDFVFRRQSKIIPLDKARFLTLVLMMYSMVYDRFHSPRPFLSSGHLIQLKKE